MTAFTIYMRPGCHLCDEAEERLANMLDGSGASIESVNIEHDHELHKKYLELIPVIEVDGRRLAQLVEFRSQTFADAVGESLSQ